jgi:hypothetical protein
MYDLNTMAALEANDAFDGIGSKLKKGVKKAKGFAKKSVSSPKAFVKAVGTIAVAPIVAAAAFQSKAVTHVLAKSGAKPMARLNTQVNRAYKSSFVRDARDISAVGAAAGAAVVGGIYAAPLIASAAGSMSAATAFEVGTTALGVAGAAASGGAASAAAADPTLAETMAISAGSESGTSGSNYIPTDAPFSTDDGEVTTVDELQQVAAASGGAGSPVKSSGGIGGLVKTLGPAAVGFAVAGPIGAGVGLAAGFLLGKKAAQTPVSGFGVLEADLITVGSGSLSAAQSRLKDLGFDPGPLDGKLGPKTRAGIAAFEKSWALPADERWADFADSLGIAWSGRPTKAAAVKPMEPVRLLPPKPAGSSGGGFKMPSIDFKDPKVIGIAAALGIGAVLLFMPKGRR